MIGLLLTAIAVGLPAIVLPDALRADLGRASDETDVTCADLKTKPTRWGLIILASEKDLATAVAKAREASVKTGVAFSTEGLSVDAKTAKVKAGRTDEGEYVARTSTCQGSAECITVEQSSAYTRLTPDLFIVVGGIVERDAQKLLARYRGAAPDAYVKYSAVKGDTGGYGATSACMDWDVIVLARTRSREEAETIAKAAGDATAIPYVATATSSMWGSARAEPFPHISVESDNAYGELDDSPFFLVVGGELNSPEKAKPKLFERYRKVVPNAYRMKRARHVCGA